MLRNQTIIPKVGLEQLVAREKLWFFTLLLVLGIFVSHKAQAQTDSVGLRVFASAGYEYDTATFNVNWTVGETMIKTIWNQDYIITQGFNQMDWEVVAVWNPTPLDLDITLFPNPMVRELTVRFNGLDELRGDYTFLVYDMLYRPVFEEPLYSLENYFDLSFLRNGTYIMHIVNDRGDFVKTFKVIKNS